MADGQEEGVDPYAYEDIDTHDYELYRIPPKILLGLVSGLEKHAEFLRAWLQAVSRSFPRRKLLDVLRNEPRAFPPFSGESEPAGNVQDCLVLKANDDVRLRDGKQEVTATREASREVQLEAFRTCRFQSGFTPEGMLCNEPPIPLQVLDFLDAQDIVRLSLVSKSTHQAAHLLFKREEAVAAGVHCCTASCNPLLCHASCSSPARVLQGIRLLSLLHGTPEAIPVVDTLPHFARRKVAHDHASWWCDIGESGRTINATTDRIMDAARILEVPDNVGLVHLLEAHDVGHVLEQFARLKSTCEFTHPCVEIELLLRAAAENGEAVLMREWRRDYGNNDDYYDDYYNYDLGMYPYD